MLLTVATNHWIKYFGGNQVNFTLRLLCACFVITRPQHHFMYIISQMMHLITLNAWWGLCLRGRWVWLLRNTWVAMLMLRIIEESIKKWFKEEQSWHVSEAIKYIKILKITLSIIPYVLMIQNLACNFAEL